MSKKLNYEGFIGQRFGRLTIIGIGERVGLCSRGMRQKMICRCECGNEISTLYRSIRNGATNSCGCFGRDQRRIACTTHGKSKTTSEYTIWLGMKRRCNNPHIKAYPHYGGRGITVCDRWLNSFDNFYADMGPRPTKNHSLDRFPDVNGNYEPNNCRWATAKEQARNKTTNVWIEYNGEKIILTDLARRFNINQEALQRYLKRNTAEEVHAALKSSAVRSLLKFKRKVITNTITGAEYIGVRECFEKENVGEKYNIGYRTFCNMISGSTDNKNKTVYVYKN